MDDQIEDRLLIQRRIEQTQDNLIEINERARSAIRAFSQGVEEVVVRADNPILVGIIDLTSLRTV